MKKIDFSLGIWQTQMIARNSLLLLPGAPDPTIRETTWLKKGCTMVCGKSKFKALLFQKKKLFNQ
jgi:hypothetical protein